jgi:hypothetical protein
MEGFFLKKLLKQLKMLDQLLLKKCWCNFFKKCWIQLGASHLFHGSLLNGEQEFHGIKLDYAPSKLGDNP